MMKNESGRSMVEMLGVLAIIGVLSVGGIAGYTMAMRKYRANEALSAAAQCVMLARSANEGKGLTSGTDSSNTFCSSITFPTGVTYSNLSGDSSSGSITLTFKNGTTLDNSACLAASAIKSATCSNGVATWTFS